MRLLTYVLTAVLSVGLASTASAQVRLTIQNGHVSLVAKDATLRQILAEWGRVGQTRIVNGDRVPGGPMTLQFSDLPEDRALETLLRPISGYIAAPRPDGAMAANISRFDRIIVMPSIAPSAVQGVNAAANPPPPAFPQFQQFPQPGQPTMVIPGVSDDQEEVGQRPPVFNTFPPPQLGNIPGMPTATPGMIMAPPQGPVVLPQFNPLSQQPQSGYPGGAANPFGGVAVPGMIAAPQPGQPGQPGQPVKRPGDKNP